MFFIGATGQLLTLILTVVLPFIFFVGGHQNLSHQTIGTKLQVEQKLQMVETLTDFDHDDIQLSDYIENQNAIFVLKKPQFKTIRHPRLQILRKSLFLICSGNKAPPVIS